MATSDHRGGCLCTVLENGAGGKRRFKRNREKGEKHAEQKQGKNTSTTERLLATSSITDGQIVCLAYNLIFILTSVCVQWGRGNLVYPEPCLRGHGCGVWVDKVGKRPMHRSKYNDCQYHFGPGTSSLWFTSVTEAIQMSFMFQYFTENGSWSKHSQGRVDS